MKTLVIKYLSDTISDEELNKLLEWLQKPKNQKKFKNLVLENYNLNVAFNNIDQAKALKKVKKQITNQESKKVFNLKPIFYYAAAAILVLGVMLTGYLFKENSTNRSEEPIISSNNIEIGSDKAILTLEDGTSVKLEGTYYKENVESNGKKLVYKNTDETTVGIKYNYLTIPRGGQYQILLSDSTKVWLNSDSKLKYPIAFQDGKPRRVELVYGEAYFDVSPSENHEGSAFIVMSKDQEIEVLGTEFNIRSYQNERTAYTTLVEGKIGLQALNSNHILTPNQQAVLNFTDNSLQLKEVDTYYETAWVKGVFAFKDKPLREITQVLSRWYDVEIIFENENLKTKQFNGVLGKFQKIEDILDLIKGIKSINNYEIHDKTIHLK